MRFRSFLGAIGAGLLAASASPGLAQEAFDDASFPQPIDVEKWRGQIADMMPGNLRRDGIPAMGIELTIDIEGKPVECVALVRDRSDAASGRQVCELLRRFARFEPARDPDGTPFESIWVAEFGDVDAARVLDDDF